MAQDFLGKVRVALRPSYYYARSFAKVPTIRLFDRRVGRSGDLWTKGYKVYEGEMTALGQLTEALKRKTPFVIDQETLPVLREAFDRIRSDVYAYLGPDARVDNMASSHVPGGTVAGNVSGSWHDDGVGHRLKLYLCAEGSGDVPTAVIPGTNQVPFRPRLSEFYRFSGEDDHAVDKREVKLRHATGTCILFDTHAKHRGVYESEHRPRTVLQIEFADRSKSNRLKGRAAIGPGNTETPRFEIERDLAQRFGSELMLDPNLLREERNGRYIYG